MNTGKKIGPQLKLLVDKLAFGNVEKFCQDYRLNPQTVRNSIRKGKASTFITISKISASTGCNEQWLLDGKGEPFANKDVNEDSFLAGQLLKEEKASYGNNDKKIISELLEILKEKERQITDLVKIVAELNQGK